jgi:hypothetical protein
MTLLTGAAGIIGRPLNDLRSTENAAARAVTTRPPPRSAGLPALKLS